MADGAQTKATIPYWLLQILAKESERLLVEPEKLVVIWLDDYARQRGLIK